MCVCLLIQSLALSSIYTEFHSLCFLPKAPSKVIISGVSVKQTGELIIRKVSKAHRFGAVSPSSHGELAHGSQINCLFLISSSLLKSIRIAVEHSLHKL